MSVNNEHLTGATGSITAPSAHQVRQRWATCTDCGNHFPVIFGDAKAAEARARRLQLDAERADYQARVGTLSDREREVMLKIARGCMPMQVAEELGIDVKTVSTYRARLMEKLKLDSNAAIAVAAYKAGLLE